MINWIVTFLIKQVLARFGVSGTLAAVLAPRVIQVVKDAAAIATALKKEGASDAAAASTADRMVLRPRAMTPDEERLWMDRLTPVSGGG